MASNRLDVVLAADDNKSSDLVTYENLIADCHRILYAIQSLSHFEIKGRSGTPSYWR